MQSNKLKLAFTKNSIAQVALVISISIAGVFVSCSQPRSDNSEYPDSYREGQNVAIQTENVIEDIEATQFKELISTQNGTILDVRTPEEVVKGHLKNAKTINIYDKDFEEQVNSLQKDKTVFVYCGSGKRSANAAKILKKSGFKKVYNLLGGITAWNDNGFEVMKPEEIDQDNTGK